MITALRGPIVKFVNGNTISRMGTLLASVAADVVLVQEHRVADVGDYEAIVENFQKNVTFPGGDEIPAKEFVANMQVLKPLPKLAAKLAPELEMSANDDGDLASVGEFVLEGLYVNNRLSKFNRGGKSFFKR